MANSIPKKRAKAEQLEMAEAQAALFCHGAEISAAHLNSCGSCAIMPDFASTPLGTAGADRIREARILGS
jgi:hypothetical protein